MKKFDNAITQIIFVEYPEGVEVMHLTKVYKNGCLVDYELIYSDGTSDEFCEKWNSDFIDCENLSPITIKASDFKEFENELKIKLKEGAIKMTKTEKFGSRIIHKGDFCKCTCTVIHKKEIKSKEVQNLDFTEYLGLLYFLDVEEKRESKNIRVKKEYDYTVAGYYITKVIVYDSNNKGEKWKSVYNFDNFNYSAK